MNGERLDTLPAHKRRVNTVFQQYALFPHLNVRDNVAYGLRVKRTPATEVGGRVEQALEMVKMTEFASAQPVAAERRAAATRCLGARTCESASIVIAG